MPNELKPCPFCGCEELVVSYDLDSTDEKVTALFCDKCRGGFDNLSTCPNMKERWNTRPNQEDLAEVETMLERVLNGLEYAAFNTL